MHGQEDQAPPGLGVLSILRIRRVDGNAKRFGKAVSSFADCSVHCIASRLSEVSKAISIPIYTLPSSKFPILN